MKCRQCGTENKADAQICVGCGYVFDNEDLIFSANEQTINAEASYKQSQIEEIKRRRDIKRKRKKIRKILLIALILLFSASVIWGAFYLSSQNDIKFNTNEVEQVTETPIPTQTQPPTLEPTIMPTVEPAPSPELTQEAVPTQEVEVISTPKPQKATKAPSKATPKPAVRTPKPVPTPEPNPVLDSKVVVVVETITDNGTQYISALTGGKPVYILAAVTAESNAYYLVSAEDTKNKINDIPVYTASSVLALDKSEFILPDSSLRLITAEDVNGFTKEQIRLARNEIYARHGRKFKDEALNSYFSAKAWYKENPLYKYNNDELNVSEIENKNAHFLLDIERAM